MSFVVVMWILIIASFDKPLWWALSPLHSESDVAPDVWMQWKIIISIRTLVRIDLFLEQNSVRIEFYIRPAASTHNVRTIILFYSICIRGPQHSQSLNSFNCFTACQLVEPALVCTLYVTTIARLLLLQCHICKALQFSRFSAFSKVNCTPLECFGRIWNLLWTGTGRHILFTEIDAVRTEVVPIEIIMSNLIGSKTTNLPLWV